MATITLPNDGWLFYSGGKSGSSAVVGNDWANDAVLRRVARQSFTAPSAGATGVSFTYHTYRGDGAFTPLRFFIGSDPDSHADAGSDSAYTGELTLGDDYMTHTGKADILLLPGQTYYIWVFPGSDEYGWYYGYRSNYAASLVTSGAAMSDITAENGTLGTEHTIDLTRYDESFTHTITATCGTETLTVASGVKVDAATWTPPLSWAAQNTAGTTVAVSITCTTYSGGTEIGNSSVLLTFALPASVKPAASIAVSDAKGYMEVYGSYVQGKSQVKAVITAEGVYGSDITGCVITCGTKSVSDTEGTFSLSNAGSITIKATVTDSRGRKNIVSETITVAAYKVPTAQITSVYRCDAEGNEDSEGAYGVAVFDATVIALNDKNEAGYTLKYRIRGTSSWTGIAVTEQEGVFAPVGAAKIFPALPQSVYEVCIVAEDAFGSTESTYRVLPASFVLMQSKRSISAISFGMPATIANTVAMGLKLMLFKGIKLTAVQVSNWDVINAALETAVSELEELTLDFRLFKIDGVYWHCILLKTDTENAAADFFSYAGRKRKVLEGGIWGETITL